MPKSSTFLAIGAVLSVLLVALGLACSPAPWLALIFLGGCGLALCLLHDPDPKAAGDST